MNGGVAKLWIGGVRQLSAGNQFVAQRAFGAERQTIFRGLAVDEEARAPRMCGGGFSSGAVAFFADNKQQSKIAGAGCEEIFGRGNHGSDDALGIAGATTPEIILIFTGGEEGGNSVHVSGKSNDRIAPENVDIVAIGLDANAFDLAAIACGERRERGVQKIARRLFQAGGGVDVHESAR